MNDSKMNTRVEFKSSAFPKYENEDDQTVNSGRWGKRLAEFVRDNLPNYGVSTENIRCEDWGWIVNTTNDEFPVWIGCGPMDVVLDSEEESESRTISEGDSPELTDFCLFVTAKPSFFKKLFKRIDTAPAVAKVVAALEEMVTDRDEFQDAVWD